MEIRIAGIMPESIVDGPGFRCAVFMQGCPHACPGCHNPESHATDGGKLADTDDILATMRDDTLIDGLTLSGGEPFMQPKAAAELAEGAKAIGLDVWVYSGFTFEELTKGANENPDWARLLSACDTLIDGRFQIQNRTLEMRFRGSKNQRVIDLPASLTAGHAIERPV